MDRNYILNEVNAMIEEKQYDRRFAPFIFHYFLMTCEQENLDEKDLTHRIALYKERVNKIQYLYIGSPRVNTDFDNKCIYVDQKIKTDISDEILDQYIYEAFAEQDIITKHDFVSNSSRPSKHIFDELRYMGSRF